MRPQSYAPVGTHADHGALVYAELVDTLEGLEVDADVGAFRELALDTKVPVVLRGPEADIGPEPP